MLKASANVMSEEVTAAKPELLKWAMILTGVSLLVIVWQGMSGIGQLGYTFEGWMLGDLHARTGEIGLLLAAAASILFILSKVEERSIKGMSFGYTTAWIIQIGLSHSYDGHHWMGMVHVMLAFLMFGHGLMMMPKFKQALAEDA